MSILGQAVGLSTDGVPAEVPIMITQNRNCSCRCITDKDAKKFANVKDVQKLLDGLQRNMQGQQDGNRDNQGMGQGTGQGNSGTGSSGNGMGLPMGTGSSGDGSSGTGTGVPGMPSGPGGPGGPGGPDAAGEPGPDDDKKKNQKVTNAMELYDSYKEKDENSKLNKKLNKIFDELERCILSKKQKKELKEIFKTIEKPVLQRQNAMSKGEPPSIKEKLKTLYEAIYFWIFKNADFYKKIPEKTWNALKKSGDMLIVKPSKFIAEEVKHAAKTVSIAASKDKKAAIQGVMKHEKGKANAKKEAEGSVKEKESTLVNMIKTVGKATIHPLKYAKKLIKLMGLPIKYLKNIAENISIAHKLLDASRLEGELTKVLNEAKPKLLKNIIRIYIRKYAHQVDKYKRYNIFNHQSLMFEFYKKYRDDKKMFKDSEENKKANFKKKEKPDEKLFDIYLEHKDTIKPGGDKTDSIAEMMMPGKVKAIRLLHVMNSFKVYGDYRLIIKLNKLHKKQTGGKRRRIKGGAANAAKGAAPADSGDVNSLCAFKNFAERICNSGDINEDKKPSQKGGVLTPEEQKLLNATRTNAAGTRTHKKEVAKEVAEEKAKDEAKDEAKDDDKDGDDQKVGKDLLIALVKLLKFPNLYMDPITSQNKIFEAKNSKKEDKGKKSNIDIVKYFDDRAAKGKTGFNEQKANECLNILEYYIKKEFKRITCELLEKVKNEQCAKEEDKGEKPELVAAKKAENDVKNSHENAKAVEKKAEEELKEAAKNKTSNPDAFATAQKKYNDAKMITQLTGELVPITTEFVKMVENGSLDEAKLKEIQIKTEKIQNAKKNYDDPKNIVGSDVKEIQSVLVAAQTAKQAPQQAPQQAPGKGPAAPVPASRSGGASKCSHKSKAKKSVRKNKKNISL